MTDTKTVAETLVEVDLTTLDETEREEWADKVLAATLTMDELDDCTSHATAIYSELQMEVDSIEAIADKLAERLAERQDAGEKIPGE